jgi:hypothetical protein
VQLEPWREDAHRQVMRLLAGAGQRSAALAQYRECRRILEAELGVEPEEGTTDLYHRIRDGGELPADPSLPPHNLPAPTTPFVGRALVLRHPATWQWTKDRVAPLIAELEVELAPDIFAAAQERGKARDLDATVRESLAELAAAQS